MPLSRPSRNPADWASRRRLLARAPAWPLALLAGCAAPWPEVPAGPGSASAAARLRDSALAHGLAAWQTAQDLNLAWAGEPAGAAPTAPGRKPANLELRLLRPAGLLAWQDASQAQPLQGWRQRQWPDPGNRATAGASATTGLWRGGQPLADAAALQDAAAQADLQALLILGPMALVSTAAGPVPPADPPPGRPVNWAEPATLDGRRCDQLTLDLRPGLGGWGLSRLALFIDRDEGLMRRLRLMVEGPRQPGARPALTRTWDLADPLRLQGMVWARRYQQSASDAWPGAASSHWRLSGLDLDRGYAGADLTGPRFTGAAAAPARALAPSAA